MRLSQKAYLREKKIVKKTTFDKNLKDKASLIINEHINRKQYANSVESEKA